MEKFKGALKKYGGSIEYVEMPEPEAAESPEKDKKAEDDSSSVLNLRNLYRQNKIDKSQYIGGLATLVATGLISKSEFTRLKTAAS